jgi:hypothetical protein
MGGGHVSRVLDDHKEVFSSPNLRPAGVLCVC